MRALKAKQLRYRTPPKTDFEKGKKDGRLVVRLQRIKTNFAKKKVNKESIMNGSNLIEKVLENKKQNWLIFSYFRILSIYKQTLIHNSFANKYRSLRLKRYLLRMVSYIVEQRRAHKLRCRVFLRSIKAVISPREFKLKNECNENTITFAGFRLMKEKQKVISRRISPEKRRYKANLKGLHHAKSTSALTKKEAITTKVSRYKFPRDAKRSQNIFRIDPDLLEFENSKSAAEDQIYPLTNPKYSHQNSSAFNSYYEPGVEVELSEFDTLFSRTYSEINIKDSRKRYYSHYTSKNVSGRQTPREKLGLKDWKDRNISPSKVSHEQAHVSDFTKKLNNVVVKPVESDSSEKEEVEARLSRNSIFVTISKTYQI